MMNYYLRQEVLWSGVCVGSFNFVRSLHGSFVTLTVISPKLQDRLSWNLARAFSIYAKCHYWLIRGQSQRSRYLLPERPIPTMAIQNVNTTARSIGYVKSCHALQWCIWLLRVESCPYGCVISRLYSKCSFVRVARNGGLSDVALCVQSTSTTTTTKLTTILLACRRRLLRCNECELPRENKAQSTRIQHKMKFSTPIRMFSPPLNTPLISVYTRKFS